MADAVTERPGYPASASEARAAWWGADAAAPTAITASAAACAWTTSAWRCRASEEGSPTNTVRVMSERYPSTGSQSRAAGLALCDDLLAGRAVRHRRSRPTSTMLSKARSSAPWSSKNVAMSRATASSLMPGRITSQTWAKASSPRAQARPMASISAALFSSRSSARLDSTGTSSTSRLPPAPATWRASSDPLRGRGDGRRPLRAAAGARQPMARRFGRDPSPAPQPPPARHSGYRPGSGRGLR